LEAAPPKQKLPANVRLLGWASLLNDVASEAVYPLLPKFLLGLGGGHAVLGLLEGTADSLASLLKLFAGKWSDRSGKRKRFIIVGYALAALSRPLMGLASHVGHVFGLRLIDRIGKGIRTAPRDAMIAESTDESQRGAAFGYHRAMDHLGAAIGPLLAAAFLWFYVDQVRSLMFLTLIPGLAVLGLQIWGLKETARTAKPPVDSKVTPHVSASLQSPTALKTAESSVTSKRGLPLYLFAILIFTFANSSDAFLLIRASEAGVATVWLPVLWSFHQLTKSVGNRLFGGLADRFSPKRLIMWGWLLYGLTYAAFGIANQSWHIWALFGLYAVFFALTEPAEKKLVAQFAREGQTGSAFGWFHSIMGFANLPSSLIFGILYQAYGPLAAFLWGTSAAFAACCILLFVSVQPSPTSTR
jgi:MFS family permease